MGSLTTIQGGSRADHRRAIGRADVESPPALAVTAESPPANPDAPIDAEIVDDVPTTPPDAEHDSAGYTAPGTDTPRGPPAPTQPPGSGLMTLEDAVIAAGDARRETARRAATNGHATVHRALPRSRS